MKVSLAKKTAVLATVGVLGLAACGSDDSKSAATTVASTTAPAGGATTTTAAPGATTAPGVSVPMGTTKPFKIMVIGDFTSSSIAYTVPEMVPAVKGVLKDFPNITVETCDAKGDQITYNTCERKAVSDNVSAVINGFDGVATDSAVIDKANIPALGYVNEKSDNSFALASSAGGYVGIGVSLGKTGCTKLGVLELDGTDFLADAIDKGFKSTGGTEVARAGIAANAPDLAPSISKLLGAGAECIALSIIPNQVIQAATAVQQTGKHPLLGGTASIFSPDVIKAMGPLAEGVVLVDSVGSPAEDTPGNEAIKADMAKVDAKAPLTAMAIYGWMSARMILAASAAVPGDITKDTLMTALNGIKDLDMMGVAHPITVTNLTDPALKRFINPYTATFTIKKGIPTKSSDFVGVADIIDAGK